MANPPTGWPPGMLQDDSAELSGWLASKPDARLRAREAASPGVLPSSFLVHQDQVVTIDYTNWRGERSPHRIVPMPDKMYFGTSPHHQEPQWLLPAWNVDKHAPRTYAMRDIHSWGAA